HPVRSLVLAALALSYQQLDLTVDQLAVLRPGDLLLKRHQPLVALLYDLLRHLAVHFGRRSARTLRVREGERGRNPALTHHVKRLLEVRVRLTGKSDDHISRDSRV